MGVGGGYNNDVEIIVEKGKREGWGSKGGYGGKGREKQSYA